MFPRTANPPDWEKFSERTDECLVMFKTKTGKYNNVLKELRDYAKCVSKGLKARFDGKITVAMNYEDAADQHYKNLPKKVQEHCWL